MYSNTWFSTEYLSGVVETTQGSMAGMTFADIIYALAFSKVLFALNNSLVNNGLASRYPNGTPCHFAAYCDDVIINVTDSKASSIAQKTACVASIAKQVFTFFKLQLNFKPGKSEFIVYLCGSGLKAARLDIQNRDNRFVLPCSSPSEPEYLRCVPYYKHMGTSFSSAEFPAEEVVARCAIIHVAVKRFWRLFRNPHVKTHIKIAAVRLYLITKGTFQCCTWPTLSVSLDKRFHSTILNTFRKAVGQQFSVVGDKGDMFSDAKLIQEYNLISPRNLLRCSRVQLFIRICKKKPHNVMQLLSMLWYYEYGWVGALKSDLKILALFDPMFEGSVVDVKNKIAVAKNPAAIVRKILYSQLANCDIPESKCNPVNSISVCSFACSQCDKTFNTHQKLSLHLWKVHNVKNPIRLHINTVFCPVCMVMFHTRERVLNHLRYRSALCREQILEYPQVLDDVQADDLDLSLRESNILLQKAGRRRHSAVLNAFRLSGPLPLPTINIPMASTHHPLGLGRNWH